MAGCAKRMRRPIAGLADGGIAQPFQETWVEQRDRENAVNPPAPFQETWVAQRDREQAAQASTLPVTSVSSRLAARPVTSMGLPTFQGLGVKQNPIEGQSVNWSASPKTSMGLPTFQGLGVKRSPIAGLADGGALKRIPGKPDPAVADDVTINAKKGEYYLTPEDVELLGGADAVEALVKSLREQAGLPTKTGPKTHGQPDNKGRMDKPGLKGIAGLANAGPLYIDQYGNASPQRPMTLQENYGMPRNVSAGQIEHTGSARPVGEPSGISRPGIATGSPTATEVPVNPRNLPVPRQATTPVPTSPAGPPQGVSGRGFQLGAEGATVSPSRPAKVTPQPGQIGYSPNTTPPLENIDAEVRGRLNSGSRKFVGPMPSEGTAPVMATAGNSVKFGGSAGAHVVLPGGGIAGELYRHWSDKSGRYIPGIDNMWGGKPSTREEISGFVQNELKRQAAPATTPQQDQSGKRFTLPTHDTAGNRVVPGAMTTAPTTAPVSRGNIAPGMESIAQSAINTGLPSTGTSIGTSAGGASVQLDGDKGLGDTTAISNRVDWSPGSANVRNLAVNDKYNEEVRRAGIANAIFQGPKTLAQHQLALASGNTTWGKSEKERDAIAGASFAAQEKGIADSKELQGRQYESDSAVKRQGIAGAAQVQAAAIADQGNTRAATVKAQQEAGKEGRKDYKERASGLVKEWGKLNLPAEHIPNLAKYASIITESEDPDGNVFLMGANGPDRAHLALPKAYESVYRTWRSKGYSHNDAAARVADVAYKAGHGIQVPNFQRYQTLDTARKNTLTGLE